MAEYPSENFRPSGTRSRPKTIDEALESLDEAIARASAPGPLERSTKSVGTAVYDKSRDVLAIAEDRVRADPWPILGGLALGTFALGFIVAKKTGPERLVIHGR